MVAKGRCFIVPSSGGETPNGLELSCRASRIRLRISRFSAAGPVSCYERLCENPEFANRVPTSTPRAWGAHTDRPHFLLPSMPFLGLAPHMPEFSHSLAS